MELKTLIPTDNGTYSTPIDWSRLRVCPLKTIFVIELDFGIKLGTVPRTLFEITFFLALYLPIYIINYNNLG